MRRKRVWTGLTIGVLATILLAGVAAADSDPLTGTWHQRDNGTSNIFYFIDDPVGDVYPVVYYDDYTSELVCGDNGPMLWTGFLTETSENTFQGSFGHIWCPNDGNGAHEGAFGDYQAVTINYDAVSDTISGGPGICEGTRQPNITTVAKAIHELNKGTYPPSPGPEGC